MGAFVRQLPFAVFFLLTALPVAAAGICVYAAMRARRQVAAIKATPTANIGMASDGYCKLEGRGEAINGHLLSSPLTQSPCVWYRARVEQWTRPPDRTGTGHWSMVREFTSSAPFFLRDATGVCTVHPWLAEVTPSDKSQWYGSTLVPTDRNPPRIDPLESAQPLIEGNARYKYYEERIYADNALLVLGEFSQGRFDAAPSMLDEEDDDSEDDVIDQVADSAAADGPDDDSWSDAVIAEHLNTTALAVTRARLTGGTNRKPFIITTQLQAVHVATSEMGSQAALALAAAFSGVAAVMLWARFG